MNPFANGASVQGSFGTDDDELGYLCVLRAQLARTRRLQVFYPSPLNEYRIAVLEDEIDDCLNSEHLR